MKNNLLATSVAVLGLALSGPAFAQNYTINQVPVPEDQVARIQAHCATLLDADASAQTTTGTTTSTGDAAAGAGAATSTAETDAQAGAGAEAAAGAGADMTAGAAGQANTDTGAAAGAGVGASPVGNIDFAALDLATVDAEACRTGGFTATGESTTTN